jgi:hypothetical protein
LGVRRQRTDVETLRTRAILSRYLLALMPGVGAAAMLR